MKCIRNKHTRTVERVTNKLAAKAVKEGQYEYVPKKVWKEEVRDAK